jgi:hypothetical protein
LIFLLIDAARLVHYAPHLEATSMVVRLIILTVFAALVAAPLAEIVCEQQEIADNVWGTVHRNAAAPQPVVHSPPVMAVASTQIGPTK